MRMLRDVIDSMSQTMVRLREEGQALAEYSLILAFIAAACVVALGFLGLALAGQLDVVTAAFSERTPSQRPRV